MLCFSLPHTLWGLEQAALQLTHLQGNRKQLVRLLFSAFCSPLLFGHLLELQPGLMDRWRFKKFVEDIGFCTGEDVIHGVKRTEAKEFVEEKELAGKMGWQSVGNLSSLFWCPPVASANSLYDLFLALKWTWGPVPIFFFLLAGWANNSCTLLQKLSCVIPFIGWSHSNIMQAEILLSCLNLC